MNKVILVGGTDLTLKAASCLYEHDVLAGVMGTGKTIVGLNSGNKNNIRYTDMSAWCAEKDIPYMAMENTNDMLLFQHKLQAYVGLAIGYHALFPATVIQSFPAGMYGIHASLLPELKGWSPLNWAILLGLKTTGMSLFKIEGDMDAGPIFIQKSFDIDQHDYIADVIDKCALAMQGALIDYASAVQAGRIDCTNQDPTHSSYCLQRTEEDSLINWRAEREEIMRVIRASAPPYHGAYTFLAGRKLRILKASPAPWASHGRPGQVFRFSKDMNFHIQALDGAISLESYDVADIDDAKSFLKEHLNATCANHP